MMNARDLLFGLHETPGIGWVTILDLFKALNYTFDQLDVVTEEDLIKLKIPKNKVNLILQGREASFIEQRQAIYASKDIQILTLFDSNYPEWLKHSSEPPWVIYLRGDPQMLEKPLMAMVGTRIPTTYGKRVAQELSRSLSSQGIGVVSGLARGIDSELWYYCCGSRQQERFFNICGSSTR
jgi:DNA processing protein